jgi:UTP-glucose-1-phosphate uridylyltransferase
VTTVCAKLGTPTVGIPFLLQLKTTIFKMMEKTSSTVGQKISITNGLQTVEREMEATTIVQATEFYLFGCLDGSTDGHFTFTPATAGTFFDGGANDQ